VSEFGGDRNGREHRIGVGLHHQPLAVAHVRAELPRWRALGVRPNTGPPDVRGAGPASPVPRARRTARPYQDGRGRQGKGAGRGPSIGAAPRRGSRPLVTTGPGTKGRPRHDIRHIRVGSGAVPGSGSGAFGVPSVGDWGAFGACRVSPTSRRKRRVTQRSLPPRASGGRGGASVLGARAGLLPGTWLARTRRGPDDGPSNNSQAGEGGSDGEPETSPGRML